MGFTEYLKKLDEKIEDAKEKVFELQTGVIGAEVEYDGESALVMEVDWEEKKVLLNYDDVHMEWVSFE